MKNERNPIPIDSKKKKPTSKTAAKHSSARQEKTPAKPKRAGQAKSTAHKSTARSKAPTAKNARPKTAEKSKAPVKSRKTPAATQKDRSDSVPARLPENKHPDLHGRSYAAHLSAGPVEPHTKPMTTMRAGAFSMARKQP